MPSRFVFAPVALALALGVVSGGTLRGEVPTLPVEIPEGRERRPLEHLDLMIVVAGGRDLSSEVDLLREALPRLPRMVRLLPGEVLLRVGLVVPSPRGGEELEVIPLHEELGVVTSRLDRLVARPWTGAPDLGLALDRAFRELEAGDPVGEEGPVGRHALLVTDDAPQLGDDALGEWLQFLEGVRKNGIHLNVLTAPATARAPELWSTWGVFSGATHGSTLPVPVFRARFGDGSMKVEVVPPGSRGTPQVIEVKGIVRGARIPREERARGVVEALEWLLRNLAASRKLVLDEEVFSALR